MRGIHLAPTTNTSDWHQPFYVSANDAYVVWHPPDDEIIVGLSPEALVWEDYGSHRTSYPPGRPPTPPLVRASSNDGSGYVTLINPGLVDVFIPASVMRGFPPVEINVAIRFARASDQRTNTLVLARLPILHGVV